MNGNVKIVAGLALGLTIGAAVRWFDIPSPAPPRIDGALVVLAMTLGYAFTDRFLATRPALHAENCGGPTGHPVSTPPRPAGAKPAEEPVS